MTDAAAILGGQIISSAAQAYANQQNLRQQQKNNNTSINLANTQHQREVADLLAAGLNPILSANGQGAAVPSLGVAHQESLAKEAASSAREIARYSNDQYKAGVEGQKLANDYQGIVNSAVEEERQASVIEAQNRRLLAEAEQEAIHNELGVYHKYRDGKHETLFDDSQYERTLKLMRQGVRSDLKIRSNANWRYNLSSFVPFTSPAGINSAVGAARGLKFLFR